MRERGRTKPAAGRIGRRAHADDQRTRTGMRVDDACAGARAALIVEDLEPLAVVQGAQRFDGDALQAPDVLFAAVRQRRRL